MDADLRTIVLRILHAVLAWFLPHARALYTRLENLTSQAASSSATPADRDVRRELDLALRAFIDRGEARLRYRVATMVAFVQSLLVRLASTVHDRVSRAEAVIHGLTSDRAALVQAAKAARLAQARAEITSRAALGKARKLTRHPPAGLITLLAWATSRRAAALRFLSARRTEFTAHLAATRRSDAASYWAKARGVLGSAFAFAMGIAAAVGNRIATARASTLAPPPSRLPTSTRPESGPTPEPGLAVGPHGTTRPEPGLSAAGGLDVVLPVAARPEVGLPVAARPEVGLPGAAERVASEGEAVGHVPVAASGLGEGIPPRVVVAGKAVAEDGPLVGLAALLADVPGERVVPRRVRDVPVQSRGRRRVPDGVRIAIAAVMLLVVTAGVGLWSSRLGEDAEKTVEAQPSTAAPPSPTSSPATVQAAGPVEAVPRIVPLSQLNPITGPDRPPLPDDEAGPFGSRRTTGTYEVALTFDDGPDPRYTPEVLSLLRQYRIKATFCVIGVNVIEFPHLVRAIAAEGHTLCNHSWVHDTGLGTRSYSTIASDMARTNEAIRAAAPGSRVSYFRHPGGAWTQAAVTSARQQGMTSLHWDVDPRDWLRPGPRAISNTVTGSTQPGSIVLLHDGGGDRLGTVEALRSILPNLVSRLRLVALPPGIDPPRLHGIHLPIHAGQQ